MCRQDMFEFIKNLFKKGDYVKINPTYCAKCTRWMMDSSVHFCTTKVRRNETLTEQTYKIFKATKLHPEIPQADQQAFLNNCRLLTKDEVLDRIIDEVVGEYAEEIIQIADKTKLLLEKRNKMLGADEVRKRLIRYAQGIEKKEDFDKHAAI